MRTFLILKSFDEVYRNLIKEKKMKKIIYTLVLLLSVSSAHAETILVIDDNGYVTQKMSTSVSYGALQSTVTTTVVGQPAVSVVRETPHVANNYYYDSYSTGALLVAGVTTAVVGALLFDEFHQKSHHKHQSRPKPVHHSSHKHHR